MLCLMFECDRRGYLQLPNGKPMNAEHIARMTGGSTDEVSRQLQELDNSGVFSRTEHGVIYSRRMVRDESIRQSRAAGGQMGAEFGKLGGRPPQSGEKPLPKPLRKPLPKPLREPLQNPPSSSSSSSDTKEYPQGVNTTGPAPPPDLSQLISWQAVLTLRETPVWAALESEFGMAPVPKSGWSRFAGFVRDLIEYGDATPSEIKRRRQSLARQWRHIQVTPKSLVEHWKLAAVNAGQAASDSDGRKKVSEDRLKYEAENIRSITHGRAVGATDAQVLNWWRSLSKEQKKQLTAKPAEVPKLKLFEA